MSEDHNKIYEFHGLDLKSSNTQWLSTCPFCDSRKFYISKKTGQYNCKSCNNAGNKYTFLTEYHKSLPYTIKLLKEIATDRGIPLSIVKKLELRYNETGDVIIPVKKPGAKNLVNLRKWSPTTKIAYNSPGCCTMFYAKWEDKGPVFICEGEWDAMALHALLKSGDSELFDFASIVAVPGAGIFMDSWVGQFKDREVNLVYDNDHDKVKAKKKINPAKDGMEMASKKLSSVTGKIKTINWSKGFRKATLKDGYDVRDLYINAASSRTIKAKTKRLLTSLTPVKIKKEVKRISGEKTNNIDKSIDTFDKVIDVFREAYSINQSFIDVLATCFATISSLKISGNPLWTFIVAPPSSGKTSIIEAFEDAHEDTVHVSKITSSSMVSGWSGGFDDDDSAEFGNDASTLSRLKNRVLFIKDFTTILTMGQEKDKLFGLLRDAYDGSYVQPYGNGIKREYNDLYFGIVAGVTHEIHRENKTSLGERFLKINLLDDSFDEDKHILTAIANIGEKNEHKEKLKAAVNGFLYHLKQKEIPKFPEEYRNRLIGLSKVVAMARTSVTRQGGEMTHRPEVEVGTRIATQLVKIGCSLAMVYDKEEVDEESYRVMQKVAFDSSIGFQFELIQFLEVMGSSTVNDIAMKMQLHPNSIRKLTKDAMEIGLIEMARVPNGSGKRGNKSFAYKLSSKLSTALKEAKVSFKGVKKKKAVSKRTKFRKALAK